MLAIYPAGFSSLVISLNIAAVKCHSLMMKYKNNKWFWPLFALFWWLRLYFPWSSSLDQSLLPAEKNIIIISTAERCSYKRFSFPSHTHYPTHPSTKNFWAFKPGVSILSKIWVFYKSSYERFEFFINMQNWVFYKKR